MRATITTQTTIRTPGAEAQCVKELAGSLGVSAHFVYQMRACGFTMRWDARLRTTVVGKVRNAWMCKPGLLDPRKPLRLHELAAHRMLSQGERSGTGLLYERWFKSLGITPANTIVSSNLVAMIGLTASGLGVSHLPRDCLAPMVDAGLLSVLKVTPVLPDVTYVAACRAEPRSSLVDAVVRLARESCDFRRAFQTA